ncbi:DUF4383 domain-containing protein [Vallicoccus soli]|uniref:DUF4383 domain-containing protein n=1 Tax=Vallicoccus soli TaxID=2339232 RepID=UPI001C49C8C9|nr:DUF4383 domain-containing protein [Vallicoccus soli]
MSTPRGTAPAGRTVPQLVALVVGAAYLLAGLAGFLVTGFDDWLGTNPDETLLGFGVNPLHNVVHLVIGAAGIALARTTATARTFGWLLVVGYGATFVYGLFAAEDDDVDILNINWADNWLHLASVLAGLVAALYPVRHRRRA